MKSKDVLVISAIDGAANLAVVLARHVDSRVEVVTTRKGGVAALRHGDFAVVVVDESMVEGDSEWADQLWQLMGLAIPVQVNFAISGVTRLGREIRGALSRRDAEYALARKAAVAEIENELKGSLTGLLLQSELAMREPAGSEALGPKLKMMVEIAEDIRQRFERKDP